MENRKRKVQIKFRCTEEEAEYIRKKIKDSGLTIQDFFMQATVKEEVIKVADTSGALALMPELKRMGNNLNQIAKRCNEGGKLATAEEVKQIKKELDSQWLLLKQLVQKQG